MRCSFPAWPGPFQPLGDLYSLGRELGRGQFGVTFECMSKLTGEKLACKSIAKSKLKRAPAALPGSAHRARPGPAQPRFSLPTACAARHEARSRLQPRAGHEGGPPLRGCC